MNTLDLTTEQTLIALHHAARPDLVEHVTLTGNTVHNSRPGWLAHVRTLPAHECIDLTVYRPPYLARMNVTGDYVQ